MKIEEVNYADVLQLRHEVMYPDKDLDFVKLEKDNLGIHLGIYEKEELASVVSIFLEDRNLQFRKLATKSKYQNKGYATALVKSILSYAKEMKFKKVWANSRVNVYPFYEQLEFKKTGGSFEKSGNQYIVIEYITE